MEGLTSREAAAALGCLAITVRTRAAHARKKVRRELSRYYPELKESP
jgi:DNA-directed RNA polymerase specialized sigma24 family protein